MKDLERLLPMNLQFFSEDSEGEAESENIQEVAEPESEGEEYETEGAEEEVTEPQFDTDRANAAFASMRRELEAARRQQAEIDALYAQQYAGYTNPETGKPITSARDYAEAMAAQERMQVRQQLQQNNIDPRVIDNMIANSPAVREAKAVTAELNTIRANNLISEDFMKVLAFDTTKNSENDIINDPSYNAVVDYCQTHPGTRFDEAYKIVNFDRLSSQKGAATKQAVINDIKGKNHLSTGAAVNVNSSAEEIPANMIETFKDRFPEKSAKELKALYNQVIKSQKG